MQVPLVMDAAALDRKRLLRLISDDFCRNPRKTADECPRAVWPSSPARRTHLSEHHSSNELRRASADRLLHHWPRLRSIDRSLEERQRLRKFVVPCPSLLQHSHVLSTPSCRYACWLPDTPAACIQPSDIVGELQVSGSGHGDIVDRYQACCRVSFASRFRRVYRWARQGFQSIG
jgi:hypothetical protein